MVLKEKKEMDDNFKKAQKPWVKILNKVDKAKLDYHNACKAERSASNQERNATGDNAVSPEQVSWFDHRVFLSFPPFTQFVGCDDHCGLRTWPKLIKRPSCLVAEGKRKKEFPEKKRQRGRKRSLSHSLLMAGCIEWAMGTVVIRLPEGFLFFFSPVDGKRRRRQRCDEHLVFGDYVLSCLFIVVASRTTLCRGLGPSLRPTFWAK